jgi:cardiolipin synthase
MQGPDQVGGHNHSGPAPATLGPATPRQDAPGAARHDSPGAPRHDIFNLPNLITFARLCAVPPALWLVLDGRPGWALAVFVLAGASDALDGWLARRRGGTVLGAWMDPAADKALLVGMFVVLAVRGLLPAWMAGLVVARDLVIIGGIVAMWQRGRPIRIRPLRVGKLNTALQILLVGVVLLLEGYGLHAPWLRQALTLLAAATTVWSGAAYVWNASRGA